MTRHITGLLKELWLKCLYPNWDYTKKVPLTVKPWGNRSYSDKKKALYSCRGKLELQSSRDNAGRHPLQDKTQKRVCSGDWANKGTNQTLSGFILFRLNLDISWLHPQHGMWETKCVSYSVGVPCHHTSIKCLSEKSIIKKKHSDVSATKILNFNPIPISV